MTTRHLLITSMIAFLPALILQVYAQPVNIPSQYPGYHSNSTDLLSTDDNAQTRCTTDDIETRKVEFTSIDVDNNGELSLAEFKAYKKAQHNKRFVDLDTDKSGDLSLTEFLKNKSDKPVDVVNEVFYLIDDDKNNTLSASEFAALSSGTGRIIFRFARFDQDHNLTISKDEYLNAPQFGKKSNLPSRNGSSF